MRSRGIYFSSCSSIHSKGIIVIPHSRKNEPKNVSVQIQHHFQMHSRSCSAFPFVVPSMKFKNTAEKVAKEKKQKRKKKNIHLLRRNDEKKWFTWNLNVPSRSLDRAKKWYLSVSSALRDRKKNLFYSHSCRFIIGFLSWGTRLSSGYLNCSAGLRWASMEVCGTSLLWCMSHIRTWECQQHLTTPTTTTCSLLLSYIWASCLHLVMSNLKGLFYNIQYPRGYSR